MGSYEDNMAPFARQTLYMSGEEIIVRNFDFAGTHPEEGTKQWTQAEEFTVQGKVSGTAKDTDTPDTRLVTGQYTIYLPSNVDVRDGTDGEKERSSVLIDTEGDEYEVKDITDEHNGLVKCTSDFEVP